MTGGDLLSEAAAELYAADPGEFVERRAALVARARAAGEAAAARSIAGLRKPTRPAWVVNRLIRSDPGVVARLAGLGDELRAAQGSGDGAAIRELSARRRRLIAELSRQAFAASGLPSPPPGLRDEVTATLGAALADPQVAGQLAAGTLERAAHADGFGPAGAPVLTLLPGGRPAATAAGGARPARPRGQAGRASGQAGRASAEQRAEAAARARAEAAAREQEERQRRRQAVAAEAEQAVADADGAATAASAAETDAEAAVRRLETELADARQGLTSARLQARRARNRQRQARQALERLRRAAVDGPDRQP